MRMAYQPLEELLPKASMSVYRLVRLASMRATELATTGVKLVTVPADQKLATTALDEIRAGKVVEKGGDIFTDYNDAKKKRMPNPKIKQVVLGVCGSIAAYKAGDIIRRLQDNHCEVTVIMTKGGGGIYHAADPVLLVRERMCIAICLTRIPGAWRILSLPRLRTLSLSHQRRPIS